DAVDPAAAALGLSPGMPLADARAVAPELAVRDADPAADRRALDDLADWCGRYTPWVASEPELAQGAGGIWLDVTGCAHLFGGERALLDDLLARLAGFGFTARAALADTPGAAWALARCDARASAGLVLPAGAARAALAALPVAGLRLAPTTVSDLERFGLARIGNLYELARGPVVARFGALLARRLDQALGRQREPISPRRPVPEQRVRRGFAEPIATREAIELALRDLIAQLCADLVRQGRGARRLELAVWRLDGAVRRLPVGTHRATTAPAHLFRLFAEHLDTLDYTIGIEVMTVAAPVTEAVAPAQLALTRLARAGAHSPPTPARAAAEGASAFGGRERAGARAAQPREKGEGPAFPLHLQAEAGEASARPPVNPQFVQAEVGELPALLDRLTNRLGRDRVTRPVAQASHIPERAQILLPLLEPGPVAAKKPAKPKSPAPADSFRARTARPPRLLVRPEPIEAIALVPDDPPRQFRWRGRTHQVRRAEGPERIAPEWWRRDTPTRDYYRIEDSEGGRFWVYRDGLYGTVERADPEAAPRWYLHGLFA
ncbi:MAG: hypothetical protein HY060_06645, partial [Proteobacteria bacterium]|nr:hypothetical protein [Pseudomonadota bacterium]